MSNMLPALIVLATGIAGIATIAGYHMLPVPSAAFTNVGPAVESSSAPAQLAEMVKRWWRQQRTSEATFGLDDHLLRDIGLTRGVMMSLHSPDVGPRGAFSDMIRHRLRQ